MNKITIGAQQIAQGRSLRSLDSFSRRMLRILCAAFRCPLAQRYVAMRAIILLIIFFPLTSFSNDELQFTEEITEIIQQCRSDGPCILFFKNGVHAWYNNYFPGYEGKKIGKLLYPVKEGDSIRYKQAAGRYNRLPSPPENFIGRKAEVYCLVMENTNPEEYPGKACTLIGKSEYLIKILPE